MAMVTMDTAEVCPPEDAILALFEYLVDPVLPAKSSLAEDPSQSQQQAVAKQMHAVFLLYNYYHRKQNPALECLGFVSFCKLAVILKPALLGHLKFMKVFDDKKLDDPENQLSVLEKTIMHACDISKVLDASRENPNVEGWPIIKVAVFLVDSKKKNCMLLFSSITQGVWSVIEKDVEFLHQNSDGTIETDQAGKKRRLIRKPSRVNSKIDLAGFQQIAYSAVKEVTGVTQTELVVLEDHIVYSVSKEKEASRFFIMQCTKSVNDDVIPVPIKDAIDSLQGPLLEKSCGKWVVTPVVEYFHVLPYAGILSEWMRREMCSESLQDSMLGKSPLRVQNGLAGPKIQDNSGTRGGCSNKTTASTLKPTMEKDMTVVSYSVSSPRTLQITKRYSDLSSTIQVENNQKMLASKCTESQLDGPESSVSIKLEMVDSTTKSDTTDCRFEKVPYKNKIIDDISSDHNDTANLSLIPYQSSSNRLGKLPDTITSKCLQLCNSQDDLPGCDRKIQPILNEMAYKNMNLTKDDQRKDKKKKPSDNTADARLDERLSKIQKTKDMGCLSGGKPPMTKDLPLRKDTQEPLPRRGLTEDPPRDLLPSDQPLKDATTCQAPSELDWKKDVACTASWQATVAKINAQVTEEMVESAGKLTFMENQEVALRHLAKGMVDVIMSLSQSKVFVNQAQDQRERLETVIKAVEETKAKAEDDAAVAREAARLAREQNDKLVQELAHAKREHERYVNEVLPTALEHAQEQAVVEFKDSKEFLSEYANGMRDVKARFIKLNPEAAQMDWSFLPANVNDSDPEEDQDGGGRREFCHRRSY